MEEQKPIARLVIKPSDLEREVCTLIFAPLIQYSTFFLGVSEKYPTGCEIQVARTVHQIDEALSAKINLLKEDKDFRMHFNNARNASYDRRDAWYEGNHEKFTECLKKEHNAAKALAHMLDIEYKTDWFTG